LVGIYHLHYFVGILLANSAGSPQSALLNFPQVAQHASQLRERCWRAGSVLNRSSAAIARVPAGGSDAIYTGAMSIAVDRKRAIAAGRAAERELDARTTRSALSATAKKTDARQA
jgi:hypothetical protein